jgi:predicted nuclease of predicted toxin-antitoxin system
MRLGNCSTADVERLIRSHVATIAAFVDDIESAVLMLE